MKMYNRYGEHLPELAHLGIRKLLIASKLDDCFDTLMERGTPRKGEEASKLVTGVTNFEGFSTSVRLFERVKALRGTPGTSEEQIGGDWAMYDSKPDLPCPSRRVSSRLPLGFLGILEFLS